jgi:hypothetical protein
MALPDFTVDRNSTKYVLGSGGDIISYATDEPAIEFNTDGSFKGLLVEPAATNLCLQSEDITTTWSPTNATLTANATTAPDGNTTADKLNDNSSGGTGSVRITQSITVSAGTKYTASVFLKADQLAFAQLNADSYDGGAGGYQYFGLSGDGTLGTAISLDDSSITKYPDGWYRCSITWTQGAADTSFNFRIWVADSISNITVDRDGTSSIFVWGAQVEEGPIATSYIPTTTASVTRLKDDITQTGASSLIGQSEGTLYVEVDWRAASGTSQYLLSVNDGTAYNRMVILNTSGTLYMFAAANNANLTFQGESSSGYSGIQKIAFAYAEDDFELYRNGSSISSDTSGSFAALGTMTDIDLGQRRDATSQANIHIRAVALYKERLSDAQCIALTS